jgi:hypothetical protein
VVLSNTRSTGCLGGQHGHQDHTEEGCTRQDANTDTGRGREAATGKVLPAAPERHVPAPAVLRARDRDRKAAEFVAQRRERGDTVGQIAEDLKASVATVLRLITWLELAQAIETGEYAKGWKPEDTEVILAPTDPFYRFGRAGC